MKNPKNVAFVLDLLSAAAAAAAGLVLKYFSNNKLPGN